MEEEYLLTKKKCVKVLSCVKLLLILHREKKYVKKTVDFRIYQTTIFTT